MYNKKILVFENHFLNSIDSIKVNLQIWRPYRAFFPVNCQDIPPQNAWLKCATRVDIALEKGVIQRKTIFHQAEKLNNRGLLTKQMQSLIKRFQTVSEMVEEQTGDPQKQAILQEYQQLADHILPTLARINQRVEARRKAPGIPAAAAKWPAADEALDVPLRAALKRRT